MSPIPLVGDGLNPSSRHLPHQFCLQLQRPAETLLAVSGAPAEMAHEPRFLYKAFVVLLAVNMIAVGNEVAQMLSVFAISALRVVFGVLVSHS